MASSTQSIWAPKPGRLGSPLDQEDFAEFQAICAQHTDTAAYPRASVVDKNVPIYEAPALEPIVRSSLEQRQSLMEELHHALAFGPGLFVVRGLVSGTTIDRAEAVNHRIRSIESRDVETSSKASKRTFGFTTKHAVYDPVSFADYYANDVLALVCEAWLGPGYQITASTNATFAGGDQQPIHRDYHMSHNTAERIARFPLITQITSLLHTLQCGIAHTDMPLECGPTRFMPFSQQFHKGYLAVRDGQYLDWVRPRMIQLELRKGDAVFFNPGTFHQPGENTTDKERVANLLQVNATFMRPMEVVNRPKMVRALWPVIKRLAGESKGSDEANGSPNDSPVTDSGTLEAVGSRHILHPLQIDALIAATCDDFGYPKQMDASPGTPDTSQAALIRRALKQGLADEQVFAELDAFEGCRVPYFA